MTDTNVPAGIIELTERSVEEKIRDFSDLIKDIESLDDKMRHLWKEVYENALADRQNAYIMFTQLFGLINTKSTEWAVHGKTLTACVERMQKANEQMIKLADLIAAAKSRDENVNPDAMYAQIKGGR